MGQEGERGEVGLGDGALDRHRQAATVSSRSLFQRVFHQRASKACSPGWYAAAPSRGQPAGEGKKNG